jgi:tripartite-type tricarboxylate transporter receptor subunit TctC
MRAVFGMGCLLVLASGPGSDVARAQAYPSHPIKLVVPFTPGTGYDTIARVVGPPLSDRLGVPVVVENKPGASSTIGAAGVARSDADGYTLAMIGEGTIAAAHLYPNSAFDPLADLAPIALAGFGTLVLVASNASEIRSVPDLLAKARERPGKLTYGSPGAGTSQHLKMEQLKTQAGIDLLHVPYRGSAGVMTDLLGGHVDLALVPIHQSLEALASRQMVALAVISDTRNQRLPAALTLSEAGIPNVEAKMWYAFAAAKGTPEAIVTRLTSEIADILQIPEVGAQLYSIGLDVSYRTPAAVQEIMRQESATALAIIKKQGIVLN